MPSFSQSNRMGRLSTVLGGDALVLMRFEGVERMNDLFDWQVDCLAADPEVDFDALIGTHATVTLENGATLRPFDGIVTEARWLGAGDNGQRYRLRLRPWFWLASLRRNQRIFHDMTVVQILEDLLAAYAGSGKLTVGLTADYPTLEYTVQFRESDMDFARRLMERHGISYHFQHGDGTHQMVLTDMAENHVSIGERPFHPDDGHHQEDVDHFWQWQPARRLTTGAIRMTDYNFKTPNAAMEAEHIGDAAYAEGQIESFDWPGDHLDLGRGKVVAELRAQAERGQDRRYEAQGDVLGLAAGARVTLGGDPVPGTGDEFLCLAASHSYTSDNYGSGGSAGDGYAYSGQYLMMPATAPMLPELKTPRADVRGPQTAVVVGEDEIDVDEFGRILVKFHWDLEGAISMRCRVSQSWAGAGWGGMVIPRVGMEVVVEFLDGDPDRPLVTGCVYNGKNPVPYGLPAHKTRSTFRTDTHKGRGFNELRFEDKRDEEEIFVHGQKDRNEKIRNNHTERVDHNWMQSVGHNKALEVHNNQTEVVGGNFELKVGPSNRHAVAPAGLDSGEGGLTGMGDTIGRKGMSPTGTGNLDIAVERDKGQNIGGNHTEYVRKDKSVTIDKNWRTVVGKEVLIDAGDKITLNCGASSITMHSNGQISLAGKTSDITMSDLIELLANLVKVN